MKHLLKFSLFMLILLMVLPVMIIDGLWSWEFGHLDIVKEIPKQFNNMVLKKMVL